MLKDTISKISYLIPAVMLSLSSLILPSQTLAEEFVVEGNGTGSTNEVNIASSNNTTVTQENTANVTNNIEITADTGNNVAEDNTGGDTTITTGDINTSTDVSTTTNISTVNIECCPNTGDSSHVISGNGSDSNNSISGTVNSTTNITVNQVATVNNVVQGSANTGNNTISDNTSGTASIATGNITVKDIIKNKYINISDIIAPSGTNLSVLAMIEGNGTGSNNLLNLNINNNFKTVINNLASIHNILNWDLNTGGNKIEDNNGDASIKTGEITLLTYIDNGPINSSKVDAQCCDKDEPEENTDSDPDDNPTTPPPAGSSHNSGGGNGGGSSSGGPAVLGAAVGNILPATGSYWIVILTLVSALMFALGLYLRRHPGQDPGSAYLYI